MLIKEDINKIIQEANTFLNEKQAYLQQLKTDDDEIKVFNKTSEDLQAALNEKSKKLKNSIFNNRLINFLSNTKEINKYEENLNREESNKHFKINNSFQISNNNQSDIINNYSYDMFSNLTYS